MFDVIWNCEKTIETNHNEMARIGKNTITTIRNIPGALKYMAYQGLPNALSFLDSDKNQRPNSTAAQRAQIY